MKRILVVDDDPASCAAATGILEALEYCVEIVPDGRAALNCLCHGVPDAVLVSLNILDMAGDAFVQALHADPRCGDVPVVVMAVSPRAAVHAIRMGARGCIKKPVDTGGVMAALLPLLRERRSATVDLRGH